MRSPYTATRDWPALAAIGEKPSQQEDPAQPEKKKKKKTGRDWKDAVQGYLESLKVGRGKEGYSP